MFCISFYYKNCGKSKSAATHKHKGGREGGEREGGRDPDVKIKVFFFVTTIFFISESNLDGRWTIQALAESGLCGDFPEASKKSWRFFEATQIKFDERQRHKFFRHISKVWFRFVSQAVQTRLTFGLDCVEILFRISSELVYIRFMF